MRLLRGEALGKARAPSPSCPTRRPSAGQRTAAASASPAATPRPLAARGWPSASPRRSRGAAAERCAIVAAARSSGSRDAAARQGPSTARWRDDASRARTRIAPRSPERSGQDTRARTPAPEAIEALERGRATVSRRSRASSRRPDSCGRFRRGSAGTRNGPRPAPSPARRGSLPSASASPATP